MTAVLKMLMVEMMVMREMQGMNTTPKMWMVIILMMSM
jgi:hypothetical protein